MNTKALKSLCLLSGLVSALLGILCIVIKLFQSHMQGFLRIWGVLLAVWCLALLIVEGLCAWSYLTKKPLASKLNLAVRCQVSLLLAIWGLFCYCQSCTRVFLDQSQGFLHLWFVPVLLAALPLVSVRRLPSGTRKAKAA